VSGPRTAQQLARELSPLLEELVNLRFLLERQSANRIFLEQQEKAVLERLVQRVRDAAFEQSAS
jgi:hypothetical protein